MSGEINLALLQVGVGPDKGMNLKKVERIIDNFEEKPDIAIVPEYLMGLREGNLTKELVKENSETLNSDFAVRLRKKARETDISLLFTAYIKKDGRYYNSSILADGTGDILGVYNKIHLFDAFGHQESKVFQAGDEISVLEWNGVKVGLATCFDLRFPELFRIMKFKKAELVLVPSAFYAGPHKSEQWKMLIRSRSHENNFFVVGVDQPGPHFVGESIVASPLGYEVERLNEGEEVRTVVIDLGEVDEAREKIPIDKLARNDFYKKYGPYRDP